MGEVYRAHDDTLDREVAIKILPNAVASDAVRLARFHREARALASLSHPNILEIYDFGTDDETSFAVIALLEGQTLGERLKRGPLDPEQARSIAVELAEGLSAAHQQEIVHRDLKPDNVFLTREGRVKLLDFGLAQVQKESSSAELNGSLEATLTQHGTVMGTPGYMSPEQVRGDPVDERTDIFALGLLAYEMLTGTQPFRRDSPAETMAAILTEDPPSLKGSGLEVAPEFLATVDRCLQKDPERRFQSAADLAFALRSISGDSLREPGIPRSSRRLLWPVVRVAAFVVVVGGVAMVALQTLPRLKSKPRPLATSEMVFKRVVVSPFENRTGDASFDSSSQFIADSITRILHEVKGAEVVAHPYASPRPSGTSDDGIWSDHQIELIAKQTSSDLVVTGAIYQRGKEIEIQARIVNPRRLEVVQAFRPIRGSPAALAVAVESLCQRIAGSLAAHFDGVLWFGLTRPVPLLAYREFMRGMEIWGDDYPAAIEHLERALELEPDFVICRGMLYFALMGQGMRGEAEQVVEELEAQIQSMTPFERGVAHVCRASFERRWLDLLAANREHARLAPGHNWINADLAMHALLVNRPREALRAVEGFPHDWSVWRPRIQTSPFRFRANAHHCLGDFKAELTTADEALEHFPDDFGMHVCRVAALAALGRVAELEAATEDEVTAPTIMANRNLLRVIAARELRAHGRREASLAFARRAVADIRSQEGASPRSSLVLVQALEFAEQWSDAHAAAEELVARNPKDPRVLGHAGFLAARTGDREAAVDADQRLRLLEGEPLYGAPWYWRAAIHAHLGDTEKAVMLLRRSFGEGQGFGMSLHTSMAFEPLWNHPGFLRILEPKG
jgi:serine/threonine protein kinase/tetratricopeptide (TPR) repeat protein